ncbi:hypothetical protein J5N97_000333 [Dioscorea zingiberensis]|uniref:SWIM-type domain-containing protein n=1 Tax=Dioscorea zingiberensis TaxID=325984 RepID=A0A9D5H1P9_9LILI|nr:hypothetical protein J5N97_000333 [Dioscorea zingiberensis]
MAEEKIVVAICQYGGEFVTNSDGTMSYTGGEAHAVDIKRDMLLDELKSEITSLFNIDLSGMSMKYFLPNNKRTLIMISCDKDLQRMVDFNLNVGATEVYILNRVDNRANGSIPAEPSTPLFTSLTTLDDVRPLNSNALLGVTITGVGQEFDNVKDFRAQLCKYGIEKGFIYRFIKNETSRVTARCVGENCPWRIHASESSRKQKFIIKKINHLHTCGGGNGKDGNRRATRQWLTSIIKEKLHESPQCKPKEIVKELYDNFGVHVSYSQVWRGREVAQKELFNTLKETYNHLPWFCQRILDTNPGSVAMLSTSLDSKFRRFFVSFHASIHGFEHGCRPLIFLDRIALRTTTQCKLLAAAAVDGDDAVFPVAFAAVEDESYNSWLWFLAQLRYVVPTSHSITFVSNRQKGLEEAIPQIFQDSHHSYCLHHLMEDFKEELKKGMWSQQAKDTMANAFTLAAQACTIEEFNTCIQTIRNISTDVADWVISAKPENWSDAFFKGARYDHFSTNIMDPLNTWIPVKHEATIAQMVDSIRGKLMEVMQARRDASSTWDSILTPSIEQKLQKEMASARKLDVLCSSESVFEVRGKLVHVVNSGTWECTCQRWQLSGLPCVHAIAAFNRVGRSVYDYCSKYFQTDIYRLAYSASIQPIPDIETIDFSSGGSSYPPPTRRPPGRPRRKRINPNKPVTMTRLCSRCKGVGHNKATCEVLL